MSQPLPTPPPTASRRRRIYGLRTAVMLLAITACCLFTGLLGSRASARMDVTVTRQHRLSQRSIDLLSRLAQPYELVIAADPRTLDQTTWQRTSDVLDALSHSSKNVTVTVLDTGKSSGVEQFDALLARLAERFKPRSDAAAAAVESAASATDRLAEAVDALSPPMMRVRESLAPQATANPDLEKIRGFLDGKAAMARVKADDLRAAAKAARETLAQKAAPVPLPATDDAARSLRAQLADAAGTAGTLADDLRSPALDKLPAEAKAALLPIATEAVALRDRAAREVATLDATPQPALLRAARALQQNTAALVIGPPDSPGAGITAIDLDSLLPPRMEGQTNPTADTRFRAEDLVVSAIVSLSSPVNPIVVFVHALPRALGPEFRDFSALADRLQLRGIGIAEWDVSLQADPPPPARLDPAGKRPLVYVIVTVPAITPDAAARMGKLSTATQRLVRAGAPVMLSTTPSTLPGTGEKDPMVSFLPASGVSIDTGRPILRQVRTPTGRIVAPDHQAEAAPTEHAISRALRGLRTPLLWPSQVEPAKADGATFTPLLTLPASPDVWAESEWVDFAQSWPQVSVGAKLPSPDVSRDAVRTDSPWTIAAAIEVPRSSDRRSIPQRLVAVGAYGWFADQFARLLSRTADPASVFRTIGNLELFEACTYWLAGQDEMIAQSPAAQSVPLIPELSSGQLSLLRWVLIVALPVLVLMLGAGWRMVRG